MVLATDGDFNVGVTNDAELVRADRRQERESGTSSSPSSASARGNLKDSTMEQIADHGNGNYHYLDSLARSAQEGAGRGDAGGTLVTIAKDVKLQLEFNPATCQRLSA